MTRSAINADDKVNHREVQRIIEQTLNYEVSGDKTTDKVGAAFALLRERRRTVAAGLTSIWRPLNTTCMHATWRARRVTRWY